MRARVIRSERQLMEQLNYNLLFRWFVGLSVDDPVWVPTVFSKNRDRLLDGDIAAACLSAVLNLPRVKGLLSDEPDHGWQLTRKSLIVRGCRVCTARLKSNRPDGLAGRVPAADNGSFQPSAMKTQAPCSALLFLYVDDVPSGGGGKR